MSSPFDYVTSVSYTKKNMMRDSENDGQAEKDYSAFMVNKALSYFADTVLHANEMNMNYHLNNRAQYEFFLNSIRRKKRWAKWTKPEKSDIIDAICVVYKCSPKVGNQYSSLMTPEEKAFIMKLNDKGGSVK